MMSEKKEANFRFNLTENKKSFHVISKISVTLFALISSYCLLTTVALHIYSKNASTEAESFFYEKSPDIVAVFTGDKGRLEYAFKVLEKYPESKLLISGVYNKNTLKSLVKTVPGNLSEEQAAQIIELDYQAKNTIENVLMTLQYIQKDPTNKKVLIISSDYHLLRIKFLFSTLQFNNAIEDIHFFGVSSESNVFQKIYDASIEGLKLIRATIISLFWLQEEKDYTN
jgi:uncharacterized SAM-binding protein YcdF (DUF218 family)